MKKNIHLLKNQLVSVETKKTIVLELIVSLALHLKLIATMKLF